MNGNRSTSILFALFAWSLLILRFGYRFGTGDQVELLPYALFLDNPSLYPNDFFIQSLHSTLPNERTVMAHLLLPFVSHLEFFCFIFQMLCTVFLVWGMERLALRFITNRYLAWLAVLVTLVPLNDFGLGNVEVYSECLQASGIATAIVVWAINYFLDRKYLLVALLMSVATIVQVLDGLDVMLVLSALLLVSVVKREVSFKTLLQVGLLYALTAGVFLLFILQAKISSEMWDKFPYVTKDEFFQILFEFRHPHHFIFASFSKLKVAVYALLTITALFYFYRKSKPLFGFVLLSTLGLAGYIVATDVFHYVPIANFQFYKVTQWVKFFGVVAAVGYAGNYLNNVFTWHFPKNTERCLLLTGAAACFLIIAFFRHSLPYSVPYQIGKLKYDDDMIRICEEIKYATPLDAVFIQPFENTELKFYAQRSSYVEFKANVRHSTYVAIWYSRIHSAFGVLYESKVQGFELQQQADDYFVHLSAEQLLQLKGEGVTHILTWKESVPALGTKSIENNTYAVYKL